MAEVKLTIQEATEILNYLAKKPINEAIGYFNFLSAKIQDSKKEKDEIKPSGSEKIER